MNTFPLNNHRGNSRNNENRAQAYYPDMIITQTFSHAQPEPQPFDATDLSQFQQDFSYLEPNFSQNIEKNSEKIANNGEKTQKHTQNDNFIFQNGSFPQGFDQIEIQSNENGQNSNADFENINSKNAQKTGINVEKIMNFMKNGSQKDLLSTMLASGVFKNQNPVMVETLSKMLSQKKEEPKKFHSNSSGDFEEM